MSSYAAQAALAVSPGFQARVQAAMAQAALFILNEAQTNKPVTESLRQQLATAMIQDAAPFVTRFAWAAATAAALAADIATTVSGVASSAAGPPAVITTAAAHGLATGAIVAIAGTADPVLAGTWQVTVTSATAFTIPAAGSAAGGAGGTVTAQPPDTDIQNAVSAAWNGIAGVTNATI